MRTVREEFRREYSSIRGSTSQMGNTARFQGRPVAELNTGYSNTHNLNSNLAFDTTRPYSNGDANIRIEK